MFADAVDVADTMAEETEASMLGAEKGIPTPNQLAPDTIRLVALAAGGIAGLRWCATCKDFYAARPAVRTVIVDNLSREEDEPRDDDAAPAAHIVGAFEWLVRMDPGALLNPANVDPSCGFTVDSDANIAGVRIPRLGDREHGKSADEGGALVQDGFCVHIQVPTASPGERRAEWWMIHEFLDNIISATHASEVHRLSLTISRGRGIARRHQRGGGSLLPTSGEEYGKRFSALRVLEVVQAQLDGVPFGQVARGAESAAAVATLVRSTSPTLRTLSVIAPGYQIQDVHPILRSAGPYLHYLSVFIPDCPSFAGEVGPIIAVCGDDGSGEHDADDDDDFEDDMMAEMESEMAEINTEMLQNSAEGLCIALLEPARILAHVPRWGPTCATRAKALRKCAAAMPDARWFS